MKKQFYYNILLAGLLAHIGLALVFLQPLQASYSKSARWRYVVIHHSATRVGNLKIFDQYHRRRGMRNGAAYHFVIDNGTAGKADGQIEISARWKKQIAGGHCRQKWINQAGVGICLVGNFDTARPTERQMQSLLSLVKLLREKYYVPLSNIEGHGKMKGEKSNCPGKNFSAMEFRKSLVREERKPVSGPEEEKPDMMEKIRNTFK